LEYNNRSSGGCSRETQHFLTTLADQIAVKKHFQPSIVMSWLRKKIFFVHKSFMCEAHWTGIPPMLCQLSYEVKLVGVGDISEL
jgi:hypothetical protein